MRASLPQLARGLGVIGLHELAGGEHVIFERCEEHGAGDFRHIVHRLFEQSSARDMWDDAASVERSKRPKIVWRAKPRVPSIFPEFRSDYNQQSSTAYGLFLYKCYETALQANGAQDW